jgi:hypothetical protein
VVTVTDCQRVQTNWFRFRAEACGGAVRTDGPMTWVDGPDGLNLMFPIEISIAGVLREVEYARDRGLPIVGAWLSRDVDAAPLAEAGFTPGWSPWWMVADLSELPADADPRVRLQSESADYGGTD